MKHYSENAKKFKARLQKGKTSSVSKRGMSEEEKLAHSMMQKNPSLTLEQALAKINAILDAE